MKLVKSLFAIIAMMVIVVSCAKEPSQPEKIMSAVTGTATHLSCRNAEMSGKANLPGTTFTDLSFGVLYSTSSGVLIGSATQIEAQSFDSDFNYTVNSEVLEPETTYYYRSYIIQDKEISYGELKSFNTLAVNSMIKTLDATEINPMDAVLNASLDLTDCKYDSLEYGFEVTQEGGSAHTIKSSNNFEKKFSAKDESLSSDTKYSVVAYVKLDGRIYKGEAKAFTTTKPSCPSGAIDLGLSVFWATCNIGASKPEEYGGYYQWAGLKDVANTSIYLDWSNCPYQTASDYSYGWTKYIPSDKSSYWSGSGSPDNKIVLDPEDDVAHIKLGGKWRMPTLAEWDELTNTSNCSWTWTSINGNNGYKVQSKKTGFTDNWIFLPAAGHRYYYYLDVVGSYGFYWSLSLNTDGPHSAYCLDFDSDHVRTNDDIRYYGRSVRPVSE